MVGLILAFLCFGLDQLTKFLIFRHGINIDVLPFLSIRTVYNEGFVFGLFKNSQGPLKDFFYYLLPVLVVAILLVLVFKHSGKFGSFGIALMLGGGAGNVVDRLIFGKVRDFIDFHVGSWHYPAFNLADVCISLGILLLFLDFLLSERKSQKGLKIR